MDQNVDDGFHDIDQLLMDQGVVASTVVRSGTREELVRKEGGNLTDKQRHSIVYYLQSMKTGNKLPWGAQSNFAKKIGVTKSTINKLLKQAEQQRQLGKCIDVSSKKRGNSGRKPKEVNEEWLESAPLDKRSSYRAYAGALRTNHMQIFRLLKKGKLRVHTSKNKPNIIEEQKLKRMKWVLSHILPATTDLKPTFTDMKNVVHIDEKWFYLNPEKRKFILLPKEADPYRTTKHKNWTMKVMFMGVSSRPIYDDEGQMIHDGKFGILPFVVKERAKHSSNNRPAGTLETKAIKSVTQEVTRDMIINKVIPSIRAKWLACLPKDIYIQQDNAPVHINNNDPAFRQAVTQDGFNMQLINQPPQSPDFNVLDLGLFRALQSLQYQSFPQNIDELLERVQEAYEVFDPKLIRFTWVQLQYVMVEVLKVKGGNNYKLPHVG